MIWLVHEYRDRYGLRINEDGLVFRIRNFQAEHWELIENRNFGSLTASLRGSLDGQRVELSSIRYLPQTILIADTRTDRCIGRVDILESGALQVQDTPTFAIGRALPDFWSNKVTAVLGISDYCTINIQDQIGNDVDILRYKPRNSKWFVPPRYLKPTPEYDYAEERQVIGEQPSRCDNENDPQPGTSGTQQPRNDTDEFGSALSIAIEKPMAEPQGGATSSTNANGDNANPNRIPLVIPATVTDEQLAQLQAQLNRMAASGNTPTESATPSDAEGDE